ncbi:MAG: class I SAM-dependent methyltransferase [Halioglobus sp.]|nr:class I SAM-dependent methyltransferase [Halioglobus sp.]
MPTASGSFELALLPATTADTDYAATLAQQLGLPALAVGIDPVHCSTADALLIVEDGGLRLQQTGRAAPGPVVVDFGSAGMRHRRYAGAREILGRAVGLGKKSALRVLDATAGLGTDAFVLADMGCEVLLCEREPVIAQLLHSGLLAAAGSSDPWLAGVVARMQLCPGDARAVSQHHLQQGVDVIYLDPMFPPRRKSAAVKKAMALFQSLLQGSSAPADAEALLQWALLQDAARVVVKRPARAPALAAQSPSHTISGKSVRYDVYVQRGLA